MRFVNIPRSWRSKKRVKTKHGPGLVAPILAAGIAGGSPLLHADTTATLIGLGTTNEDVPVNHGSNGEATLTWDANWDQYADWNGRGDVYQIDQPITTLVIAPAAPTIKVTLDSFELDEWAGGGDTSATWSVTGSASGILSQGTWDPFNSANDPTDQGGRSIVNAAAMGAAGESLTLSIDHTNMGSVSYLAMDNLVFSTIVVPEPASSVLAWLGVSGLGALAMRRKKAGIEVKSAKHS
jgi:hypothetical protein